MTDIRSVAILGSTGSIGTQALKVIAEHPDRYAVRALAAGRNLQLTAEQAVATRAPLVALAEGRADELRAAVADVMAREASGQGVGRDAYRPEVVVGDEAAVAAAGCGADVVLNGITGSIGLFSRQSFQSLNALGGSHCPISYLTDRCSLTCT